MVSGVDALKKSIEIEMCPATHIHDELSLVWQSKIHSVCLILIYAFVRQRPIYLVLSHSVTIIIMPSVKYL